MIVIEVSLEITADVSKSDKMAADVSKTDKMAADSFKNCQNQS